ncbi:hypothetical protein OFY17_00975 [Marinomonas sp. C2222]|uniref:DUF4234 domain-containing protein n=1 Tax=Marinomonas sargassi TaxID=2984494 RepID=A0ABT2YNI4_9GAMM|nr:hypothetical protein [Marinomonas sargassi]MCV2401443.1 hypothetical protein [Marinomonas sargassi]
MYRINHKAIVFLFVVQAFVGLLWYSFKPMSFIEQELIGSPAESLSSVVMLLFALSIYIYLLFTAWLLSKMHGVSSATRCSAVLGMWLFVTLPNYVFISLHFDFNQGETLYLLSYGALSCFITAAILPLWGASRSIFKS